MEQSALKEISGPRPLPWSLKDPGRRAEAKITRAGGANGFNSAFRAPSGSSDDFSEVVTAHTDLQKLKPSPNGGAVGI